MEIVEMNLDSHHCTRLVGELLRNIFVLSITIQAEPIECNRDRNDTLNRKALMSLVQLEHDLIFLHRSWCACLLPAVPRPVSKIDNLNIYPMIYVVCIPCPHIRLGCGEDSAQV